MKNKLAMFDMDGTLYDTIDSNYYSYKTAVEREGLSLDRDFFINECYGHNYKVFVPMIAAQHIAGQKNKPADSETVKDEVEQLVDEAMLERIHQYKKDLYTSYLDKIRVNEHLFNIIELIKGEYNIALVTTASKKNVYEILDHFGHAELFDYVFTQEDVKEQKPDPKCYLLAMEHFGCDKSDSIIFEDSPVGLQAAHRSGARIFKVEKF